MAAIVPEPATVRPQSPASKLVLGRFAAVSGQHTRIRENFSEFFTPGSRARVRSPLLVAWEPRSANFARNLRDLLVTPLLVPAAIGGNSSTVPEIWSKRTLLKRLQSLSLSYHVVLLVFAIAPFLPELLAPATTQARSGPWQTTTPVFLPRGLSSAPTAIPSTGGGSGGDRNPLPATTGRIPPFRRHIPLAPPSARPPLNPALSVPTTLVGEPGLVLRSPDLPNWGDPASQFRNDSNGPGYGGGIGNNFGGGIGPDGEGAGYGPGDGGNTGGGDANNGARVSAYPICSYCPNPQFSEEAVKTKLQGAVLLSVTITTDGRATNIRVVKGIGAGLDEKAVEAVRTWRFKPALGLDGKPAAITSSIEVTFHLY